MEGFPLRKSPEMTTKITQTPSYHLHIAYESDGEDAQVGQQNIHNCKADSVIEKEASEWNLPETSVITNAESAVMNIESAKELILQITFN